MNVQQQTNVPKAFKDQENEYWDGQPLLNLQKDINTRETHLRKGNRRTVMAENKHEEKRGRSVEEFL